MEPVLSTNIAYGSIHTRPQYSTGTRVRVDTPTSYAASSGSKPGGSNITESEFNTDSSNTSEIAAAHLVYTNNAAVEYLQILPSEENDAKNEVAIELEENQSYGLTGLPNTTQASKEDSIPLITNTCYEQTNIRPRRKRRIIVKRKRQPKYEKAIEVGVMVVALISMTLSFLVIIMAYVRITSDDVAMITNTNTSSDSTAVNEFNFTGNATDEAANNMSTTVQQYNCSCSAEHDETYTVYLEILQDIQSNVTDMGQELMMIDDIIMEPVSAEVVRNIVQYLNSRIDSIHGSINQLRVQATNTCSVLSEQQHITEPVLLDDLGDQTCPVNITEGHQLTSTIDIDNECTMNAGIACQVQPTSSCFTFGLADFLEDDQILMDFTCYVVFSNPNITGPPNGTAAIRQESFINATPHQNIFNEILSDDPVNSVGCQCLSFESSKPLSCRYIARFCNYERGQVTSTIVP